MRLLGVLLITLVAAPAAAQNSAIPVWWSPELDLESLDALEARLTRSFAEEVAFNPYQYDGAYFLFGPALTRSGEEEKAENCLELLEAIDRPVWQLDAGRSVLNQKMAPWFFGRCEALRRLRDVHPASRSFLPELRLEPGVLGLLPHIVSGFTNAGNLRAALEHDAAGRSWAGYLAVLTFARPPEFSFEVEGEAAPGQRFRSFKISETYWTDGGAQSFTDFHVIRPLASGDFDGDGLEDLLLYAGWRFPGASYAGGELFVLTRWTDEGPLRLLERDALEAIAEGSGG